VVSVTAGGVGVRPRGWASARHVEARSGTWSAGGADAGRRWRHASGPRARPADAAPLQVRRESRSRPLGRPGGGRGGGLGRSPGRRRRSTRSCDCAATRGTSARAGPAGTAFRRALEAAGWRLGQGLVWVKDSIVLGHSDYHYQHEDILFGHKPGPGRSGRGRHAGTRWYGGNDQSSVLFADRPKRSADHPTSKPVDLLGRLLRNSTRSGDVVLDPFAGSGSTLIACEQLGRCCVAVELDPRYCDVIRRRYAEFVDGR